MVSVVRFEVAGPASGEFGQLVVVQERVEQPQLLDMHRVVVPARQIRRLKFIIKIIICMYSTSTIFLSLSFLTLPSFLCGFGAPESVKKLKLTDFNT